MKASSELLQNTTTILTQATSSGKLGIRLITEKERVQSHRTVGTLN